MKFLELDSRRLRSAREDLKTMFAFSPSFRRT
jgi:hypothetical protein